MNHCPNRLIQLIPFKYVAGALALFSLSAATAHADISLRSTNATYTNTSGSGGTFAWPINDNTGCSFVPELYPTNISYVDVDTGTLNFVISTSTSSTETRYIKAEWTYSVIESLLLNGSTGTTYVQYTGDPNGSEVSFQINLKDLCAKAASNQSLTADCRFTAHTKYDLAIRVGITKYPTDSLISHSSENNTSAHDYEDFTFHIVRCGTKTQAYVAGKEVYTLRLIPGDGRAKVLVGTSPSLSTTDYTLQSKLFLFEASSTSRPGPMTIAQATIATSVPGTGGGEYTVDNLTNDTTYNVQMAYTNEGGFITVPGPPDGATAAPTVTPSGIAGLLDRNTCFIATAAYGNEWDPRLEILRQFRGQVLSRFAWGQNFIRWYYGWSPSAAEWLIHHQQYRGLVRVVLFPFVQFAAAMIWMGSHLWFPLTLALLLTIASVYVALGSGRRRRYGGLVVFIFLATGLQAQAAQGLTEQDLGDTQKVQPYIESLKKKQGITDSSEAGRPKGDDDASLQPYINHLKNDDKSNSSASVKEGQPYIDRLLEKNPGASPSKEGQPHIEALKNGLELKPRMVGTVKNTISVTAPVAGTFEVSGGSAQANSFESIYRTQNKYNPGVDIYLEHHLIRDRHLGAFGPFFRAGAFFQRGTGRFTKLNAESDVKFSFTAFPLGIGLGYRAIQPRFVVPFVQAGVVGIPFLESRDDDKPTRRGLSSAVTLNYGLNLSLDWIGRKGAWDRYDEFGIFHTYLVVQQMHMKTFQGVVDFRYHTTMAGLAFEY